MKLKVATLKYGVILTFLFLFLYSTRVSASTPDDYFQISIVMDGVNITEALDRENAIIINPNSGVISKIECLIFGNNSLEISYLKTVFIVADIDATSQTDLIEVSLSTGGNFTYIQTWKFNNYVGNEDIALITGEYMLRYDVHYIVDGQENVIKGQPFFVKFDANPASSVFGLVSTVALASTGVSYVGLANSLRGLTGLEFENSIGQTKVSPSAKLRGYYRGKSYSIAQAEVSNLLYGYASKMWEQDKCPQCTVDWPKEADICPGCQITYEAANELYTKSLVEKSLTAVKEVVDSVSGLSLKGIADKVDEGVIPTSSIVSVLTFSGLTLVKPRVSKNWSQKQRKLVFTGLSTSIYALFWVQACGLGVVSLAALIVAVLSGFIISAILGWIPRKGLRAKIGEFWENSQLNLK